MDQRQSRATTARADETRDDETRDDEMRWAAGGRVLRASAASAALAVALLAVTHLGTRDAPDQVGSSRAVATGSPATRTIDRTPDRNGRALDRVGLEVIQGWNVARADAWRNGDVEALRALYADEAPVGDRDLRKLQAWVAAGWQVEGLVPAVSSVESVRRAADEWVLDVRETLSSPTARRDGTRVALPSGFATERRITLVSAGGYWRVRSVETRSEAVQSG